MLNFNARRSLIFSFRSLAISKPAAPAFSTSSPFALPKKAAASATKTKKPVKKPVKTKAAVKAAAKQPAKPKKPVKDPLKPKGRVTAYSFFLKEYAKENNITKVTELGRAVGAAWKAMSPQERAKYEQLDREDKVRYERERDIYLKNKEATAPPKRSSPPYLYFFNENRAKILTENPGISFSEVAKRAGAQWKALSDSEKQPFVDISKEAKIKYRQELEAFKQKQL
ncbi:hypothetical protein D0Z00_000126 [Geotrichum galactomycetum]|uniref:Uncharacterized protein n=1 Tax=Geotrichum galactomycetum TaxID=27317 RepID=A0ACB6VAE9_9ASCO|nr:hypothetical protein D0Z00_000126 [Geotrichum candidum]